MPPLTVLVLESDRDASAGAAAMLAAAGHTVVRCHDDGAPAFPCHALQDDRRCPLQDGTVDVALTVRSRPRSQPAPHEDGVACALERHVPVVVAGATVLNPYESLGATVADRDDVVRACEEAATRALDPHTAIASRALHAVLAEHGMAATGSAVVRRVAGRLVVTIDGGPDDQQWRGMAAVRMIAALRTVDHDARGIDVVHV